VAFNVRPVSGSWGGGNQWLIQLTRHLRESGYAVAFDLKRPVDCIIVANVRGITFGTAEIAAYRSRHPGVRCLHCVHDNDAHRSGGDVDRAVEAIDAHADHTVFVSEWLRDYHAERWFDRSRTHSVIQDAADPAIFHPFGSEPLRPGEPMRLVTHHWSANPNKGFEVYGRVGRLISAGELPDVELTVIGRWPGNIEWGAARTYPPTTGQRLADLLRSAHVYFTASLWEAAGMHFIEGAQCGLPLIYHEDGGGIVEIGRHFGIAFRDDPASAIRDMRDRYDVLRRHVLENAPAGDAMCARYRRVIQQLLAG
jgi:glycosyltransferase involved in cell wall biosynthesis